MRTGRNDFLGFITIQHLNVHHSLHLEQKLITCAFRRIAGTAFFRTQNSKLNIRTIRADGKFEHDMYLLEVKKPSESTAPWDYYHVRAVIPAKDATLPLSKSTCKLVKK